MSAPFADIPEFLEAVRREFTLLLEADGLRGRLVRAAGTTADEASVRTVAQRILLRRSGHAGKQMAKVEVPPETAAPDALRASLAAVEEAWRGQRLENRSRAAATPDLPLNALVARCGLNDFERDVLLLVYCKMASPEFRQVYGNADLKDFSIECGGEVAIGNLLRLLCPGSLRLQSTALPSFASDAPLVVHNLIDFDADPEDTTSILEICVSLPSRMLRWISGDTNNYALAGPFRVERPEVPLARVILPEGVMERVLTMMEHHPETVKWRKRLGLDDMITYGRAVALLEYGPPGTGKTLLAKAISHQTGRPLISLNLSSGSRRRRGMGPHDLSTEIVQSLFREAQITGGIVFIDECDTLCSTGSDEARIIMAAMERSDALVIMATNRPERLEPALDRRFSLKIPFELPDVPLRRRIWELHLPPGLPEGGGIDLDRLAVSFPLAGGYIKNAVLAALSIAVGRVALGGAFNLTQADLEVAARQQEQHIGGIHEFRTILHPKFGAGECPVRAEDRDALRRIARVAGGYRRQLERWAGEATLAGNARGYKVLVRAKSPDLGMRAAEGLAGELCLPADVLHLHHVLDLGRKGGNEDAKFKVLEIGDIFTATAGNGHILIFRDDRGLLGKAGSWDEQGDQREFFDRLASFAGVAVLVTGDAPLRLPAWARVFHDTLHLNGADAALQEVFWRGALAGGGSGIDTTGLARRHDLSFEEVCLAIHRGCLLLAGTGGAAMTTDLLDEAAGLVKGERRAVGPLFGVGGSPTHS
jgi:hypothetical protein